MTGTSSADRTALVSPDRVRNVLQAVLRAAQAHGFTDVQLEQLSGVPARAIKSYRVEGREPCLHNALSLCCVLGPQALNPLLALIGYVAEPLDEGHHLSPGAIVAEGLHDFAIIAQAAADGRIDHTEELRCQKAADHIIEVVLPLSSAGHAV